MTHKEKREFFNWLKKQGVLEEYKRNRFNFLYTFKDFGYIAYPSYQCLPKYNAIGSAFKWYYTPEGFDFWQKLNDAWTAPLF